MKQENLRLDSDNKRLRQEVIGLQATVTQMTATLKEKEEVEK